MQKETNYKVSDIKAIKDEFIKATLTDQASEVVAKVNLLIYLVVRIDVIEDDNMVFCVWHFKSRHYGIKKAMAFKDKRPTEPTEQTKPTEKQTKIHELTTEWDDYALEEMHNEIEELKKYKKDIISKHGVEAFNKVIENATEGQYHTAEDISPLNIKLILAFIKEIEDKKKTEPLSPPLIRPRRAIIRPSKAKELKKIKQLIENRTNDEELIKDVDEMIDINIEPTIEHIKELAEDITSDKDKQEQVQGLIWYKIIPDERQRQFYQEVKKISKETNKDIYAVLADKLQEYNDVTQDHINYACLSIKIQGQLEEMYTRAELRIIYS